MTSQVFSILIDLPRTAQSLAPFLWSFYKSLNLNNSGTRRDTIQYNYLIYTVVPIQLNKVYILGGLFTKV